MDPSLSSSVDCIQLEQLEVLARVGVTENERRAPQRITVTIKVWPATAFENLGDNILQTVNYSEIADAVREYIETRSDKLIETLATGLASLLLAQFSIRAVEVELRKFVLPGAKYVSVMVRRTARNN